jgi:ferredoxin-NADP reductase
MRVMGPYRSEYGELFDLLAEQRRPPILCVSTGAGAGLVLDVVSTLRTLKHVGATPVEVIFSTWSVNLLQYVTNQLLAEAVPGLQVSAALTRVEDEVDLEDPKGKGGLSFDRIDLNATIDGLTDDDTRVYFCGAGAVNRVLARACARRGVRFVGSTVESASPPPSQPPMEDERESEREVEETVISIHHHEDECCERGPRSADSSELEAPVPFASSLAASFLNLFAAKN